MSLPTPAAAKLDFCGSCTRPVDKGETCAKCGWNNVEKERYCRQCKKKLSLVSAVSRRPAAAGVIAIGAIAAFAGGFVLFGVLFGAAALALTVGLSFVADGLTLRYSCKTCTVAVYSERLQKEESLRVRAARGKSLSVAVACAVMTGGFVALTGFSANQISDSSYGIAWTIQVPRTHSHVGSEVTSVKVPTGTKRMRVQFAERPYVGGRTYLLSHIQYTYPAGPTDLDKPGLDAFLRQAVEVAFTGTLKGNIEEVGDSMEASFSGTFHGKPVFGRLRATQYEHDMVFVAVTSGSEADVAPAAVEPFLSSVAVTRDGS